MLDVYHRAYDPLRPVVGFDETRKQLPASAYAGLAAHTGKMEQAIVLWVATEALREEVGSPLTPQEREACDHDVAEARRALGEEAFTTSWAMGRAMALEQAIAFALQDSPTGNAKDNGQLSGSLPLT